MATIEKEASQKKDERKIKRDANKAAREAKRDSKAGDIVSKESGRYGIDLADLQRTPVGDASKARITEGISQATNAEKWDGTNKIAGFQKAAPDLVLEDRPDLNKKALKDSVRKQRRSAWVDALTAFGQGVTTGRVNPESLRSTKFKRERDTEFQNYRDITERNKKTKNLWEHQNRTDLLDFVNKQIADKKNDAETILKYQRIADDLKSKDAKWEAEQGLKERGVEIREEANRLRGIEANKKRTISTSKNKTPYTDKFEEATGGNRNIINEFAKHAGYALDANGVIKDSKDKERISNILMKKMFTVTKDEDGNTVFTIIPGREKFMTDLMDKMREAKDAELKISELQMKIDETPTSRRYKDTREENQKNIDTLREQLKETQTHVKDILEGRKNYIPTSTPEPTPNDENRDWMDDFTK